MLDSTVEVYKTTRNNLVAKLDRILGTRFWETTNVNLWSIEVTEIYNIYSALRKIVLRIEMNQLEKGQKILYKLHYPRTPF
jgi:hypothetical protein